MKILVIHRYFFPDTPHYASMLLLMAQRWASDGHQVTVFSTQPSYNPKAGIPRQPTRERANGIEIVRFPLLSEIRKHPFVRTLNAFLFAAGFRMHCWKRRYHVIMAATHPPVVTAWAARRAAAKMGAHFLYHCQDIHPELSEYSGLIQPGHVSRFLRSVDKGNCEKASRVVVLSSDMAATLKARMLRREGHIRIINNFILPDSGRPFDLPPEFAKEKNKFRILFAGNIGRFQGLETILEAAKGLRGYGDMEFVFVGDGSAKEDLMRTAEDLLGTTVRFHPHQPLPLAKKILETADLGLITLRPQIYKCAYPSKTMTNLEMGCPLLLMIEPESELSRLVVREQIGYVCPPGDITSLQGAIVEAYENRDRLTEIRLRAQRIGRELFGTDRALHQWSDLMQELAKEEVGGVASEKMGTLGVRK